MLAAYKLQLSRRAKELGQNWVGTWGKQNTISAETEERLLEGEGDFRLPPFPYPGLRSFDPKEGRLFFGRDHSVTEVQKRLANYGIATVLGGSGSGKSSLVRAGLLPYLNSKRRIPGRVGSWYMAEFRPRMNPLDELADALTDQVMLPLLDIGAPGLAEAMGLTEGDQHETAKQKLRNKMRARFHEAQAKGGGVRDSLLHFVDCELDEFDKLASRGVRVPGASLMLLLDQFEEVFRSEIAAGQRQALLDLVVGLHASISRRNERNERTYKGGLFLVITMRSEELHRCAEHRGLSEVINRSFYLLELLDPDNEDDAKELYKAIVRPARDVFDDWGIAYDRDRPDAPFANGVSAWLLSGAGRRLPHQPDQLPLLQHALQATWHAAMRRWSHPGFVDPQLEIRWEDLPGQDDPVPVVPDLGKCLRVRADKAAERAKERFAEMAESSKEEGEKVLRAAFRALAHRDDRGNWTRRFASIDDIKTFLAADQNFGPAKAVNPTKLGAYREIFSKIQKLFPSWLISLKNAGEQKIKNTGKQNTPDEAIQDSLSEFLIRGYLSGGNGSPYDISHEALIRNWPRFQEWLSGPESAARALERVVQEIDPRSKESRRQRLLDWIPAAVSEQLSPVLGPDPTLPRSWALHRLESLLERSALRERWQYVAPNSDNKEFANAVLHEIDSDRKYVDGERRKEVRRKVARKFIPALAVLAVGGVIGVVLLWFTLLQSMAALYAAHAESLLALAVSERGAQMPPERRAQITLRSVSYIEMAARLGGESRWVHDNILPAIFSPIDWYLPTRTNVQMQLQARRAFDFTSREVLGRRFAILTDLRDQSVGDQSPNCVVIGEPTGWLQVVPEHGNGEQGRKRAFQVKEAEARQGSPRLEFGVVDESGGIQLAASDIQVSLPSGAWLCLSADATVLTLSDVNQNYPDLYELQWTRCAPESECRRKQRRDWRVRYVPIPLAQGAEPLPLGFPCVTSIRPLPDGLQVAKFQVTWTYGEATCNRNLSSAVRVAEFFTALAVPRAVQIPSAVKDLLTKCDETNEDINPRVIYSCTPRQVIEWKIGEGSPKFSETNRNINTSIVIEGRGVREPDTLDVSVTDNGLDTIAAKVSLPASRIHRAGITESGEVFLQDDDANVTWRFLAKRSRLQALLRERGCGQPKLDRSNDDYSESDLEGLRDLGLDNACAEASK
jgi:hypothetical protein